MLDLTEQKQAEELGKQAKEVFLRVWALRHHLANPSISGFAERLKPEVESKITQELDERNAKFKELFLACPEGYRDLFEYLVTDHGSKARRDYSQAYLASLKVSL